MWKKTWSILFYLDFLAKLWQVAEKFPYHGYSRFQENWNWKYHSHVHNERQKNKVKVREETNRYERFITHVKYTPSKIWAHSFVR